MPASSPLITTNSATGRAGGMFALAMGLLAVLVGIVWTWTQPKRVTAVVTGKEWQRVIYTERLSNVTEEGWRVPDGARVLDSFPAVTGYRAGVDRYQPTTRREEDRVDTRVRRCGRDYLSRDLEVWKLCADSVRTPHRAPREYRDAAYSPEPVYGMRYRYLAARWTPDEALWRDGTTEPPAWPELEARPGVRETSGSRRDWYGMTFTDAKGRVYSVGLLTPEVFARFERGDRVRLRVWRSGSADLLGAAK